MNAPLADSPLERIFSGGQTGVDRAALDVALERNLPHGGWRPRGRRAEDGPIDARYRLQETPAAEFAERTEWNVRDSDATLILHRGPLTGGTALTADMARRYGRPLLCVDLDEPHEPAAVGSWLCEQSVRTLNIAGPRESLSPGIAIVAGEFLRRLFAGDV